MEKIDRRALPVPGEHRDEKASLAPPRDTVEMQLVQIWEETLGVRPIGIEDHFFELGGPLPHGGTTHGPYRKPDGTPCSSGPTAPQAYHRQICAFAAR